MNSPDLSMNFPPWINSCLHEVCARSGKLTTWEWRFIGYIRDDVFHGHKISDQRLDRLAKIREFVFKREKRIPEKEPKPYKPKPRKDIYV